MTLSECCGASVLSLRICSVGGGADLMSSRVVNCVGECGGAGSKNGRCVSCLDRLDIEAVRRRLRGLLSVEPRMIAKRSAYRAS
jgi:hypothetical protein